MNIRAFTFFILSLAPLALAAESKTNADTDDNKPAKKKKSSKPQGLNIPESENDWEQQPAHNLATLERLLKMSPTELRKMRSTLQRIEQMPPKEKNKMLSQIKKFKKLQQDKREEIVKAVKTMKPEHQAALKNYWDSLDPDDAEKMREELSTMSQEERNKWRQSILNNPKYKTTEAAD